MNRTAFEGKLTGAVGNFNALVFSYPSVRWQAAGRRFVKSLGLTPNDVTTQILPMDSYIAYWQTVARINAILTGLCQDLWSYISRGLVFQKTRSGEIGSSTMPQKVNPIDFENAEGNLSVANAYFELYGRKLSVSRLQRDLSDSTVKRTVGTATAHTVIAWESIRNGLSKISFHAPAADAELSGHYEILGEAVQLYLKKRGDEKGYEKVKAMLAGKQLTREMYMSLVVDYPDLAKLTPESYSGIAEAIAKQIL